MEDFKKRMWDSVNIREVGGGGGSEVGQWSK